MKLSARNREPRKAVIKAKAQEIIYARYPQWKQSNLLAAGDEQAIADAWSWIDAVRSHSNWLESQVHAGVAVDIESGWPGS